MKPSLSVITICFNNLSELIETCRSVDEQTLLPDEHLIIDGSTNDQILSWLLRHPQPVYRHWVHERDKGISDAFNKGINYARSEVTHLLNSGDRYTDARSIETVMDYFTKHPELMWLHSKYIQHRGNIDIVSGLPFDKNQLWKGMRTVAHPTMFIKREVYARRGLYNTYYKIAMDFDMLVRIREEKNKFISLPLVYFAPGGASDTNFHKGLREVRKAYRSNMGISIRQMGWQLRQQLLHWFMKTGLGKKWFRWKNERNKSSLEY